MAALTAHTFVDQITLWNIHNWCTTYIRKKGSYKTCPRKLRLFVDRFLDTASTRFDSSSMGSPALYSRLQILPLPPPPLALMWLATEYTDVALYMIFLALSLPEAATARN